MAPTRYQPRRAAKKPSQREKKGRAAAKELGKSETGRVLKAHKPAGDVKTKITLRSKASQKARKKLQEALIKRVDARDPEEAAAEQMRLFRSAGTSYTPNNTGRVNVPSPDDKLQRAVRCAPSVLYRRLIEAQKPAGVPLQVWEEYVRLGDYIYGDTFKTEGEDLPMSNSS
ncbi:hypothetical protein GGS20DRAFT_584145 [Poronia punctata]|nr:hypothetical protein GGS20DRAFT_584145 [Poronia punctata]